MRRCQRPAPALRRPEPQGLFRPALRAAARQRRTRRCPWRAAASAPGIPPAGPRTHYRHRQRETGRHAIVTALHPRGQTQRVWPAPAQTPAGRLVRVPCCARAAGPRRPRLTTRQNPGDGPPLPRSAKARVSQNGGRAGDATTTTAGTLAGGTLTIPASGSRSYRVSPPGPVVEAGNRRVLRGASQGSCLSFCLIHPRPLAFTSERGPRVRAGHVHSRPVANNVSQYSKACEGAILPWVQIPPPPLLTCDDVRPVTVARRASLAAARPWSLFWSRCPMLRAPAGPGGSGPRGPGRHPQLRQVTIGWCRPILVACGRYCARFWWGGMRRPAAWRLR